MTTATPTQASLPDIKHSFDLTEDQRMIQEMVRDFAKSDVEPIAHAWPSVAPLSNIRRAPCCRRFVMM